MDNNSDFIVHQCDISIQNKQVMASLWLTTSSLIFIPFCVRSRLAAKARVHLADLGNCWQRNARWRHGARSSQLGFTSLLHGYGRATGRSASRLEVDSDARDNWHSCALCEGLPERVRVPLHEVLFWWLGWLPQATKQWQASDIWHGARGDHLDTRCRLHTKVSKQYAIFLPHNSLSEIFGLIQLYVCVFL